MLTFQFHIGDFQKNTYYLNDIQRSKYLLLLMHYYNTETPIPVMRSHCERIAMVVTNEEKEALDFVLDTYFTLTDTGYVHSRAEEEILKYKSKSLKAKESANKRWAGGNYANALPTHSEGNANHKPLTINQKNILDVTADADHLKKPDKNPVPFQKIQDLYHKKLPELPQVFQLTAKRQAQIRTRWINNLPTLDLWEDFFDTVSKSKFLTGRSPPVPGRKPFRADLEWLTNETNFTKIAEGKYE